MKTVPPNLPTTKQINARAYEIFLQRGGQPGHAKDDWLQAEYELLQIPVRKLAELPASKAKRGTLIRLVQTAMLLGSLTR